MHFLVSDLCFQVHIDVVQGTYMSVRWEIGLEAEITAICTKVPPTCGHMGRDTPDGSCTRLCEGVTPGQCEVQPNFAKCRHTVPTTGHGESDSL